MPRAPGIIVRVQKQISNLCRNPVSAPPAPPSRQGSQTRKTALITRPSGRIPRRQPPPMSPPRQQRRGRQAPRRGWASSPGPRRWPAPEPEWFPGRGTPWMMGPGPGRPPGPFRPLHWAGCSGGRGSGGKHQRRRWTGPGKGERVSDGHAGRGKIFVVSRVSNSVNVRST